MGILDDYKSDNEAADEEASAVDPSTARRKRLDLERQIVILNSDLGKLMREIEDLEMQKRKFKKEEEKLRIDRDELDKTLKKMNNDRTSLEDQIRELKKKLKALV
jgi:chromosome segregation ATPase